MSLIETKTVGDISFRRNIGTNRWFKVCSYILCKNIALDKVHCRRHKNGVDNLPPKKEIIISDGILEIKVSDNIKYCRTAGSSRWYKMCLFESCKTQAVKDNYCQKHRNGVNNPIIKNINDRQKCEENSSIGDETEIYIENIIKNFTDISECQRIGHTGDKMDIIYKMNNEKIYRGIQIKTLYSNKNREDSWSTSGHLKYDKDTLIVSCNKERTRFCVIFSQYAPKSKLCLSFASSNAKYSKFMFSNYNEFVKILHESLPKSKEYIENITIRSKKEKESLIRLESQCKIKFYSFNQSNKSGCIYDCIINNYKIQCKYTATKAGNAYLFALHKSGPNVNGKDTTIPYAESDDIDFFIIEVEETLDNFYIIPKQKLIDEGILSSDKNIGVKRLLINHSIKSKSKYSWILNYYNTWDLLINKTQ